MTRENIPIIEFGPKNLSRVLPELRQLRLAFELAGRFAARDFRVKYSRSVFSPAWVVLSPIITVGVFTFVFGLLVSLPSNGLPYLLFYLIAIVHWYYFANLVNFNAAAVESYLSLISKVYFPKVAIPISNFYVATVDFLVGAGLILAFGVYFDSDVAFVFISLFLSILMTASFGTGIGLLLAVSAHRIRDIKMAIPLGLQLWFFLTPIIYPMSLAPSWATIFYWLNPLAVSIETMRRFAKDGTWDPIFLAVGLTSGLLVFALGSLVFIKTFERAFGS